jgi:SMI1 / KNR4 family (SUKH-1)
MVLEIMNPNPYGMISLQKLQEFEIKQGINLPEDYRSFLKKYNGGKPNPAGFWIERGVDGSEVHQFFGLHDGPKWLSLEYYVEEPFGISKNYLAIGDDGTGNILCMKLQGHDNSSIYFIDHDIHDYNEPGSLTGFTKVANSFAEFLSGLTDLPNP